MPRAISPPRCRLCGRVCGLLHCDLQATARTRSIWSGAHASMRSSVPSNFRLDLRHQARCSRWFTSSGSTSAQRPALRRRPAPPQHPARPARQVTLKQLLRRPWSGSPDTRPRAGSSRQLAFPDGVQSPASRQRHPPVGIGHHAPVVMAVPKHLLAGHAEQSELAALCQTIREK
jgi:hypothetical protein